MRVIDIPVRPLIAGGLLFVCVSFIGMQLTLAQDSDASKPNILLIIGDDMGNEPFSCYGLNDSPANTPTLDELCNQGVRFDNFWSQPVCSPTRATMLTGRYGFRTGVGRPTSDAQNVMGYWPEKPPKPATAPAEPGRGGGPGGGMGGGMGGGNNAPSFGLQLNEFALPMAFKTNPQLGYSTAAIGKWHLSDYRNGWEQHPNLVGFDHFSGLVRGFPDSFFTWIKTVNGEWSGETGYIPDDKTNDAIDWIAEQEDNPWFLWMAYNLGHTPLHLPPENRWRSDWSHIDPQANPSEDSLAYFNIMLESMDVEIERMLNSLSPEVRANTYVIFMGDNGTSGGSIRPPIVQGKAKGTIYQGGVLVPLFVTGPGVVNGSTDALVNSTDMFMTIMELAGIDVNETLPQNLEHDSVSFLPYLSDPSTESIRDFAYVDVFAGNFAGIPDANFAIRNGQYKLLRHDGNFEFYDLSADPWEHSNLLEVGELSDEQQAQHDALLAQVTELRASS